MASSARTGSPRGGAKSPTPAAGEGNRIKDTKDWVTGEEPMTGAQASYLKTLSEEAHEPEAFDPDLHKAEASERIDDLRAKTGKASTGA